MLLIMVGGSGLYVDAVTQGLDVFPDIDSKIRISLNKRLETEGLASLQEELKELDFNAYQSIAIDNPHRVIRALEICIGSDQPYSSYLNKEKTPRNFRIITIGLTAERALIYERINSRVDLMIEEGLLVEAKSLFPKKHLNALNTVGYKELFKYFEGLWTLDFAISEIKKNSRRFAKRQLTWFKRNKDCIWFKYDTHLDEIKAVIQKKVEAKN